MENSELAAADGWSALAEYYYELRRKGGKYNYLDLARISEFKIMLRQLEKLELNDKVVLDVGCGFGFYSVICSKLGAEVIAVDFSPNMLELCLRYAKQVGVKVQTHLGDASDLYFLESSSIDIVVSGMDLDVPDLNPPFAEFSRLLRSGGRFLMSVPHPVHMHGLWTQNNDTQRKNFTLYNYFRRGAFTSAWETGEKTVRFREYLYTTEDYVNALVQNGFAITALFEGEPDESAKEADEEQYHLLRTVPTFLIIEAVKIAA